MNNYNTSTYRAQTIMVWLNENMRTQNKLKILNEWIDLMEDNLK
ncbi:MAG: hypothetical protein NTX65_12695 [Ignavibacteriales bacterium]|nr:hypothetical protein [Ignavibacteriales bacterium]